MAYCNVLDFVPVLERKLHVNERLPFAPSPRATGWEFNVDELETKC